MLERKLHLYNDHIASSIPINFEEFVGKLYLAWQDAPEKTTVNELLSKVLPLPSDEVYNIELVLPSYKVGQKIRFFDESGGLMVIDEIEDIGGKTGYYLKYLDQPSDQRGFIYEDEIFPTKKEALEAKENNNQFITAYLGRE